MKRLLAVAGIALAVSACARNKNSYQGPAPLTEGPVEAPPGIPRSGLQPVSYYKEEASTLHQTKVYEGVDFLIAIDNSASMDPYLQAVQDNLSSFVQTLQDRRIDFRVMVFRAGEDENGGYDFGPQGPFPVVVAAQPDAVERLRKNIAAIRSQYQGVDELPVWVLRHASEFPTTVMHLRPRAARSYLVLSDVESLPTQDMASRFFNEFAGLSPDYPWVLSAIGSPSANPCAHAETPQHPYTEALVAMSGGVMGRVCDPDYAQLLGGAAEVSSRLLSEFSLAQTLPDGNRVDALSIRVLVNGVEVPRSDQNGFLWIPEQRAIRFAGTSVPPAGARVEVSYDYWIQ